MKILIADDHSLIIDGFITVLKNQDPSISCYMAIDKLKLFEILKNNPIDILFQDIMFGKTDARDFIKEIKENYPKLKIIIISSLADENTVNTLFKQDVDGYLLKSDPKEEIFRAIETLHKEGKFISKGLVNNGNQNLIRQKQNILLTPREKEILSLILQEKTTKEIAELVFLSEKTVENHRANLFIKFDVKNLAGLVKKAILEGFL